MAARRPGSSADSAEEAFARLIALRESGQEPDFETWVRDYPQLEAELRALYESWDDVGARLAAAFEATTGPDSPLFRPRPAPALEEGEALFELRPGARVGEFQLVRLIAQGGMGQVWEALQIPLARIVALKFIRPDRTDERSLELFEREARAGGRLNDPRLVTVHATGESEGLRWIAQEYVPGGCTLADVLAAARKGPARTTRDYQRLARFFLDVAEALHAAHQVGVVHRDLKPQNVLVAPDDRPKVGDFGLARLLDETSISGSLSIVGTLQYMSPEQATGDARAIDRRSDVFSFGTVLYEALTLRRPFGGETPVETLAQITQREPPPPRGLAPTVPEELAAIATKALEKRPADRFQTLEELAAELRRYLAGEPLLTRPPGPLRRAAKWCRRHPGVSASSALGVMLAVAVVVAWVFFGSVREERKQRFLTQALWDIENGQLARASEQLAGFREIAPDDPESHLVMAAGYARFLRIADAEVELRLARDLGYDPDAYGEDDPRSLYLYGLFAMTRLDRPSLGEAADCFERAIELDDELSYVWFPLYQLRAYLGDSTGAREALDHYKQTLKFGDDVVTLVDALQAELLGDHTGAIDRLESMRSTLSDKRMVELRVHRYLGRNYLLRYLESGRADPDDLVRAQAGADLALEAFENDAGMLACRADVQLLRAQSPGIRDEDRDEWLARAEEDARQVLDLDPSRPTAAEVMAIVELERAMRAESSGAGADELEALLDEVEARLEELHRIAPESPAWSDGMAQLLYLRSLVAQRRGDREGRRALLEESVAASERQLWARVILGGRLFLRDQDFPGALELFVEALDLWDGAPDDGLVLMRRDRRWIFATLAWIVGTADQLGDEDRALEARDRILQELEQDDARAHWRDMLNLAEFLGTAKSDDLLDCEQAWRLLERYDVAREVEALGDSGVTEEFRRILGRIRDRCPE